MTVATSSDVLLPTCQTTSHNTAQKRNCHHFIHVLVDSKKYVNNIFSTPYTRMPHIITCNFYIIDHHIQQ
jgi:hypothetical protein